ncbi:hypothetical protein BsWGS_16482 [Bradybaena similaris]
MESIRLLDSLRIIQIVLFIEVATIVQSAAQICPYTAVTCKCSGSTLECTDLLEIPTLYTGTDAANIRVLYLLNGNITSISGNSLPPGLDQLHFSDHPLTNLSDDAFNSSAQTLTSLAIDGGDFRHLPKALLVLTNLTALYIRDTPIKDWNNSILNHIISNVRQLQLKNVGLSAWPDAISLSHQIVYLDLSDNLLKNIPDNAFLSFNDTLEVLDLANTGLTQVPQALSTLSNLIVLDLSGIHLTNVRDIEQLASMPFGKHPSSIDLESSGLKTILNFSSFTSLLEINLNNNSISNASSGSFPLSLTELWLQENHLTSVPTTIANLPYLSDLDLSFNQIRKIEPGSLPSSLKTLDLGDNRLTAITNTTFKNMTNLSYLILSDNLISTIDPSAFTDLLSLGYLSIFRSNLSEIPLAIASLPVDIELSIIQFNKIPCPCPPPQELVHWFALHNGSVSIDIDCLNYVAVERYLTTGCIPTTTAALADTSPGGTTASPGGSTNLKPSFLSISVSVLLMMAVWMNLY